MCSLVDRPEAGGAVHDRLRQVHRQHHGRHRPSHLHVWCHRKESHYSAHWSNFGFLNIGTFTFKLLFLPLYSNIANIII